MQIDGNNISPKQNIGFSLACNVTFFRRQRNFPECVYHLICRMIYREFQLNLENKIVYNTCLDLEGIQVEFPGGQFRFHTQKVFSKAKLVSKPMLPIC